eukprot:Gb_34337 [translate_table: standard]
MAIYLTRKEPHIQLSLPEAYLFMGIQILEIFFAVLTLPSEVLTPQHPAILASQTPLRPMFVLHKRFENPVLCFSCLSRDQFVDYWINKNMVTMDLATQIFTVLKQPDRNYLNQVLMAIINTSPYPWQLLAMVQTLTLHFLCIFSSVVSAGGNRGSLVTSVVTGTKIVATVAVAGANAEVKVCNGDVTGVEVGNDDLVKGTTEFGAGEDYLCAVHLSLIISIFFNPLCNLREMQAKQGPKIKPVQGAPDTIMTSSKWFRRRVLGNGANGSSLSMEESFYVFRGCKGLSNILALILITWLRMLLLFSAPYSVF